MDHKPIEELIIDLDNADPADAPDIADAVASSLSDELETESGADAETPS